MSSPQTNLWLERTCFDGVVLAAVFYGAFLILTVQSALALTRRPPHGRNIADHRIALIFYIVITFVLVTISTAAHVNYMEMTLMDLREAPSGSFALTQNIWKHPINILALCCAHIQEWIMQALLLQRCFVIWNWTRFVVVPMLTIYIAMIGLSIAVQVETSTGAMLYDLNTELAYLCVQVGHTVLYTILVVYRLFAMRSRLNQVTSGYNSGPYGTIILMIIESAVVFTTFALIFIFALGFENDGLATLSFLCIGKVQGITQLFIILHVARGRAITQEFWSTQTVAPTTLMFAGTDTTESQESAIVEPEKVAEGVDVSVACQCNMRLRKIPET